MIVLNTKTEEELMKESLSNMETVGISTTKGGIARLFLAIINKIEASFYTALKTNHLRAFVTTATEDALDDIGMVVNCKRMDGEEDEDFRHRIETKVDLMATSNRTAIYLTALCIDGVSDVILTPFTMGSGTFSVLILPELSANAQTVLTDVAKAIDGMKGYGIRFDVRLSSDVYLSITQHVEFIPSINDADKQELRYQVQQAIEDYISSLTIGESFIIDQLTEHILSVSKNILSTQNISIRINGKTALYVNQSCRWFERFVTSKEDGNIVVL